MSATRTPGRRPRLRARLSDALYVVISLVAATTITVDMARTPAGAVAVGASLVVGVAALLVRRRRPLLPALGAVPGMIVTGGIGLLPLAVLALAIRRRGRSLAVVAVGGWALSVAVGAVRDTAEASTIISDALTLALAAAFGAYVGARRDLLASLRARAEEAEQQLALRADQARLAERTRIAREMHDVLAHRISLIGLHAGGLEVAPAAGPEVVERSATLIRETAHSALEDLRGVLGVLRADASAGGADLAPQPRREDLPALVASSAAARLAATHEDAPPPAAHDDRVGRFIFRLVH